MQMSKSFVHIDSKHCERVKMYNSAKSCVYIDDVYIELKNKQKCTKEMMIFFFSFCLYNCE